MSGKDPLPQTQAYQGVKATNPPNLIKSVRAPTTNDFKYPIGTIWINTTTSTSYQLVKAPGIWTILGNATGGDIQSLTGGSGGAILPTLGNINLIGTSNQINTVGSGSTITWSLPSAITAPGSLTTTTTLAAGTTITAGTGITSTAGNIVATAGAVNAGTTMTAGTGITSTTGNIVATAGAVNAGTSMTATLGNITATNGNIVRGTAGNKDVYTSVATTIVAGANSAGTVALAGGTATVATTAVTASSQIRLYRQGIGATGAAALGHITLGTVSAGVSFIINSVQAADATALQASDVSVIGWEIVN